MSQPMNRQHYAPRQPAVPPGGVMRPRVIPAVRALPLQVWMTVDDASTMLGVSRMTVYRLIHSGELPATRIRKSFRIKESDFEKYVRENTITNE